MKKLFLIAVTAIFFASCEKLDFLDKKDKPCPVVAQDGVPTAVVSAFQTKHPGVTVKTWFNKDNNGFAAMFDNNGKDALDFFDNSGNFQKEEMDGDNEKGDHQNGNHHDKDDDKGCDCETED